MGFIKAEADKRPLTCDHGTNETFMPVTGKWNYAWNTFDDLKEIIAGRCDVVSLPAGCDATFRMLRGARARNRIPDAVCHLDNAPAAELSELTNKRVDELSPPK